MKRLLLSILLAAVGLPVLPLAGHVTIAKASNTMKVAIVSVTPRTISGRHAVTFRIRVSGIIMDSKHLGKTNVGGHGHLQIYVGKIPSDAYTEKDLRHYWLAALAVPDFTLDLSPALLGGKGKHMIFVVLAQNNYVLYRVPAATTTLTAR